MSSIYEILAVKRWPNGGVSIGNSYLGTTPPANGMIIEGNVGIGTLTPLASASGNGKSLDIGGTGTFSSIMRVGASSTSGHGLLVSGTSLGEGIIGNGPYLNKQTGVWVQPTATTGFAVFFANDVMYFYQASASANPTMTQQLAISTVITVASLGTGTVYSNVGQLTNVNPSSADYKRNIQPWMIDPRRILALDVQRFDWDQPHGERSDFGFIAEDVKTVAPELYVEQNNTKGYLHDHLVFYHHKLLQQSHARITTLEAEVVRLRARLN